MYILLHCLSTAHHTLWSLNSFLKITTLARVHMMIYSACNQHIMLNHIISSLNNYGNLSSLSLPIPRLLRCHTSSYTLTFWQFHDARTSLPLTAEIGGWEKIIMNNNKKIILLAAIRNRMSSINVV